jgi:hypothetical protein
MRFRVRHLFPLFGLAVLLVSCNEPSAIELIDEELSVVLDVTPVAPGDSNFTFGSIDSIALTPGDQTRFAGSLVVAGVRTATVNGVSFEASSRVVFVNRLRPVQSNGRVFGFHGIDLGTIRLNSTPMFRVPHPVRIRRFGIPDSIVLAGFHYVLPNISFTPNTDYVWSAMPDTLGVVQIGITSPDEVLVQEPRGGSIHSRAHDLRLRWTGRGDIAIVISAFEPQRGTKPLLMLKPRINRGHAVISARLLQSLPADHHRYVLTFVIANRNESHEVGGFNGPILAQAASIFNTHIELR